MGSSVNSFFISTKIRFNPCRAICRTSKCTPTLRPSHRRRRPVDPGPGTVAAARFSEIRPWAWPGRCCARPTTTDGTRCRTRARTTRWRRRAADAGTGNDRGPEEEDGAFEGRDGALGQRRYLTFRGTDDLFGARYVGTGGGTDRDEDMDGGIFDRAFRGNGVDVKLRVERILFNYYIHIKILLWDWGWNGGALNRWMGLGNEDRY